MSDKSTGAPNEHKPDEHDHQTRPPQAPAHHEPAQHMDAGAHDGHQDEHAHHNQPTRHVDHDQNMPTSTVPSVPHEAHDRSGGLLTESIIAGVAEEDAHTGHAGHAVHGAAKSMGHTDQGKPYGDHTRHGEHVEHDARATHDAHAGHGLDHTGMNSCSATVSGSVCY